MRATKMIFAVAAITMISLTSASARHLDHHSRYAPRYHAQGGVPYDPGAYRWGPDPYGVYFGSEEVGRDPDPNVRQELQNDYSYLYSW